MCNVFPETLALFQTQICDFPFPVLDMNLNSHGMNSTLSKPVSAG